MPPFRKLFVNKAAASAPQTQSISSRLTPLQRPSWRVPPPVSARRRNTTSCSSQPGPSKPSSWRGTQGWKPPPSPPARAWSASRQRPVRVRSSNRKSRKTGGRGPGARLHLSGQRLPVLIRTVQPAAIRVQPPSRVRGCAPNSGWYGPLQKLFPSR